MQRRIFARKLARPIPLEDLAKVAGGILVRSTSFCGDNGRRWPDDSDEP